MNRRAFTLVELLVVVAVIGVLIAIGMSAFGRSREAARSVVCLSNLRQVGLLVNTYLSTSDGFLPALENRRAVDEDKPTIDTVLGGGDVNPKVFDCPADDRGLYEQSGTSYFWNFTVNGQSIHKLFSIAGGNDPQRVPLLADKEGFHPDLRDRLNVLYVSNRVDRRLSFVDEVGAPIELPDPPDGGAPN